MTTTNEGNLPKDLDSCHSLIAELYSELAKKTFLTEKLEASIEKLIRHRFGQRADRIDPNQFLLFKDEILASLGEVSAEDELMPPKKKQKHKQKQKI